MMWSAQVESKVNEILQRLALRAQSGIRSHSLSKEEQGAEYISVAAGFEEREREWLEILDNCRGRHT